MHNIRDNLFFNRPDIIRELYYTKDSISHDLAYNVVTKFPSNSFTLLSTNDLLDLFWPSDDDYSWYT